MGLASRTMDLRLLKKLVFNSVKYAAMEAGQKAGCQNKVQAKWDAFMQTVASQVRLEKMLKENKIEVSIVI